MLRGLWCFFVFCSVFLFSTPVKGDVVFRYSGAQFNPVGCVSSNSEQCPAAFISASVAFQTIADNFTGTIQGGSDNLLSLEIIGNGVGAAFHAISLVDYLACSCFSQNPTFTFVNGQITEWSIVVVFANSTLETSKTLSYTRDRAFNSGESGNVGGQIVNSAGLWTKTITSNSIQGSLQISTTSLPASTSGQPYTAQLMASGGSGSGYVWSSTGVLPAGFSLSPAGVLSSTGTPAAPAQTYSLTVRVVDLGANSISLPLMFIVKASQPATTQTPSPASKLTVITDTLLDAISNKPYSAHLVATGGTEGAYNWTLSSGILPPGFSMDGNGLISFSGTPFSTPKRYDFTVSVADLITGNSGNKTFSLTVLLPSTLGRSPEDLLTWKSMQDALLIEELAAEANIHSCSSSVGFAKLFIPTCEIINSQLALQDAALASLFDSLGSYSSDLTITAVNSPIFIQTSLPVDLPLSSVVTSANELLLNQSQEIALLGAAVTAINKATGAMLLSDSASLDLQNKSAIGYLSKLTALLSAQPALRSRLQAAWMSVANVSLLPTRTDIQTVQLQLKAQGVSPDRTLEFRQVGLNSTDILELSTEIQLVDPDKVLELGGFPTSLSSPTLISAIANTRQALVSSVLLSGSTCSQLDLAIANFGTRREESGFIGQLDLNSDGIVNVVDLATIARGLPSSVTCP